MNTITEVNPLFKIISHENGKDYFTSHFLHQEYKKAKGDNKKYETPSSFNKVIRSIHTFPDYVERGDIIESVYSKISKSNMDLLHKSNSYKPIMLISATAQMAIMHHLDDAFSKMMSVTSNESIAESHTKKMTIIDAVDYLESSVKSWRIINKDGEHPTYSQLLMSLDYTKNATGVDLSYMKAGLTKELPDIKIGYTPTRLGEVGFSKIVSAVDVNNLLSHRKLQTSDGNVHIPTEIGLKHCYTKADSRYGSGYKILWYKTAVEYMRELR